MRQRVARPHREGIGLAATLADGHGSHLNAACVLRALHLLAGISENLASINAPRVVRLLRQRLVGYAQALGDAPKVVARLHNIAEDFWLIVAVPSAIIVIALRFVFDLGLARRQYRRIRIFSAALREAEICPIDYDAKDKR